VAVRVLVAITTEAERIGEIVNANVLEAMADVASVTVTV
jgi:hypothetical protein